jgi:hypothetical protein
MIMAISFAYFSWICWITDILYYVGFKKTDGKNRGIIDMKKLWITAGKPVFSGVYGHWAE